MSSSAEGGRGTRPAAPSGRRAGRATGAREIAATVLLRVWQQRAYANAALSAELKRHSVTNSREGALATELVYGVLRTTTWLEGSLAAHATSDRWKKQPLLRAHLLIAAYGICFLDRMPAFATVDQAVEAIRQARGRRLAGFANAVLRKLSKAQEGSSQQDAVAKRLHAFASTWPSWLRKSLGEALGGEQPAHRFITAGPLPPPVGICVHAPEQRPAWLVRLRRAAPGAELVEGRLSPHCITANGAGYLSRLPGHGTSWHQQEEGAQLVALALGGRPGDQVLDACAGRGGKTLLLAGATGPRGAVDAADCYPAKLERLLARAAPSGIRDVFAVDWTLGSGPVSRQYDRVLVDAPCSGVGTVRRRPELVARLTAADIRRLSALQLHIARAAARHLRPGGRLVYAVCSVLTEECERVIEGLTAAGDPSGPRLTPAPFDAPIARSIAGDGCSFRLLPQQHGTDGFFVASLQADPQD